MQVYLELSSLLLIIALILAFFLGFFFWNRRKLPGISYLMALFVVVSIWLMGATLETTSQHLASRHIWQNFETSGGHLLAVTWLVFILHFTTKMDWPTLRKKALFALPALLAIGFTWINPWQLVWQTPNNDISSIGYQQSAFGPLFWFGVLCNHAYLLISIYLLGRALIQPGPNRLQILILLLCSTIPGITNLIYVFQISRSGMKDPTPYLFIVSVLLFIFAIFRLRMFHMVSFDLDTVVAAMNDALLVISLENLLLYLNPAAEKILGLTNSEVSYKPIQHALSIYPLLLEKARQNEHEVYQIIELEQKNRPAYFKTTLSFLHDRWGSRIGKILVLENITHRVEAEQANRESQEKLRQSEETYRQLVENINEIVFTVDCNGYITYISPILERHTGYAPEEIVGKHFNIFLSAADMERLQHTMQRTLAGEKQSFEFRITNKFGVERVMLSSQQNLMRNGKIAGIQGMLTDITERIQVEEALERRAAQLAILNDIGEKIAALMDLKGVLDRATQLIQSNFGYYHVALFLPNTTTNMLVMRSSSGAFSTIFPENHRLKAGQGMVGWVAENKTLLLSNDVRREPRYANLFPDRILTRSELTVPVLLGEELLGVLDIQSPMLNAFDDNDVRVMQTIANQIAIAIENARLYEEVRLQLKETERKENILRIQRDLVVSMSSTSKLHDMLNTAVKTLAMEMNIQRVAIMMLNGPGSYLEPVAMLGYPEQIAQQAISLEKGVVGWVTRTGQPALIADVRQFPEYLDTNLDTLSELCVPLVSNIGVIGVINLESPQVNAFSTDDLRLLVILANNLVVLIERGRLFQEVESARAQLEERASALESANIRLRELDRLKSQFLANMSHELRTPLNSIIGFSEILIDNLVGPLSEDQSESVHNIHDSGLHLLALINDLLDFSKIEAGKMVLDPSTFTVSQLFNELRMTISPLTDKKAQQLTFSIADDLPALTADHLRIKQVFINLLSNAHKFSPENGEIEVSCQTDKNGLLLFAVKDNGIGIQAEHQDLIFEEFRQIDGSLTRRAAGTGLGLAISKRIVLLHHGKIWVESRLGQGATFYISLPVAYHADMI